MHLICDTNFFETFSLHMLFYVSFYGVLAIPYFLCLSSDVLLHYFCNVSECYHFFVCSKVGAKAIFHRLMGPRHHSLDAIDSLSLYKVIFLSCFYPISSTKKFPILVVGYVVVDYFSLLAGKWIY